VVVGDPLDGGSVEREGIVVYGSGWVVVVGTCGPGKEVEVEVEADETVVEVEVDPPVEMPTVVEVCEAGDLLPL
jgi:hypothetical protein